MEQFVCFGGNGINRKNLDSLLALLPPSSVTQLFFLLARGLFSMLRSHQQHLLLTSTCTLQCNTMSLALVVILVAFLTGASGSPSVTMKPEIHLGSNPSSGVPDTAGEAHFFEEVRLFF